MATFELVEETGEREEPAEIEDLPVTAGIDLMEETREMLITERRGSRREESKERTM